MTVGIYKLNFSDNSFYIGQSIQIEKRYGQHCSDMRNGRSNAKVQNKYNELQQIPSLEILAECEIEDLDDYENECLEIWDAVNVGLNIAEKGSAPPKLVSGASPRSFYTYSKEQILDVFYYLVHESNLTYVEIEKITNVNQNTVKEISSGKRHSWLQQEFPEDYAKLIELRPTRLALRGDRNKGKTSAGNRGIKYPLLESPEGLIFNIENVSAFAKEHGLQQSNLNTVLLGKRKSHKGWKLFKEKECQN